MIAEGVLEIWYVIRNRALGLKAKIPVADPRGQVEVLPGRFPGAVFLGGSHHSALGRS